MIDLQDLLRRQAEWQRARAKLSWHEKMRMVEIMRESFRKLRGAKAKPKNQ